MRRAIEFGASGLQLGERKMAPQEVEQYLRFIIHLFQSFEAPHVSRVMLQLVKIQLWYALSGPRREVELMRHSEAASYWRKMTRKDQKAAKKAKEQVWPWRADGTRRVLFWRRVPGRRDGVLIEIWQSCSGSGEAAQRRCP